MIIKTPEVNDRNTYLSHNAIYDKEKKYWIINDSDLTNEDKMFFLMKGENIDTITNLWIMYYLSMHNFNSLSDSEKICIINHLTQENKNNKDMDIPFFDFVRITEIFSVLNENQFYDKSMTVLMDESKNKEDAIKRANMSDLEKALFYYNFKK